MNDGMWEPSVAEVPTEDWAPMPNEVITESGDDGEWLDPEAKRGAECGIKRVGRVRPRPREARLEEIAPRARELAAWPKEGVLRAGAVAPRPGRALVRLGDAVARPGVEVRPGEGRPGDARSGEVRPGEARPEERRSVVDADERPGESDALRAALEGGRRRPVPLLAASAMMALPVSNEAIAVAPLVVVDRGCSSSTPRLPLGSPSPSTSSSRGATAVTCSEAVRPGACGTANRTSSAFSSSFSSSRGAFPSMSSTSSYSP